MLNNELQVEVSLTNEKVRFSGVSVSNPDRPVEFDYLPPLGDGQGYRGLELLLLSFAGCVSTAIVYLLRRMGKDIAGYRMNGKGISRAQPLSLEKVSVEVVVDSGDITEADMETVVSQAKEISPVWLALKNNVEVSLGYQINGPSSRPDKNLAAVCGLFCPACSLYIGTKEEPERLKKLSERLKLPVEALECHGCRSEKRSFFCRDHCKMTKCSTEKGIGFCIECEEYPCEELKEFQSKMPHRVELWNSLERIREAGYEQWFSEMVNHHSCPECHALNSAYDLTCRKCGSSPGSDFVKLHQEEIEKGNLKI